MHLFALCNHFHSTIQVLATVCTFVRNLNLGSENNPYRVTLRKLWAKVAEPDPRTQVKALYMLHMLLRESDPEDSVVFKRLLEKMSKEYCKKTNSYYFRVISNPYEDEEGLRTFAEQYAAYVFRRGKAFTSHFEEMKMITHGMDTEVRYFYGKVQFMWKILLISCRIYSASASSI